MKGEIFVNISMKKMVSLDSQDVIPMIHEKFREGTCIMPVKFTISEIKISEDRLEIFISPLESFKLEQIEVLKPSDYALKQGESEV